MPAVFSHHLSLITYHFRGATLGHRADDAVLRNLRAAEFGDSAAVAHDDDARASFDQFLQLRRDHQDAEARAGKLVYERLNLALRADVYAARGLVEYEELRVLAEPAR